MQKFTVGEDVCSRIGYLKTIRVDSGSEFISSDMDLWTYRQGVTLDFSRPSKPTDKISTDHLRQRRRKSRPKGDQYKSPY